MSTLRTSSLRTEPARLREWSERFDWEGRARAYDLDRVRQERRQLRRLGSEMTALCYRLIGAEAERMARRLRSADPEDVTADELRRMTASYLDLLKAFEKLENGRPEDARLGDILDGAIVRDPEARKLAARLNVLLHRPKDVDGC